MLTSLVLLAWLFELGGGAISDFEDTCMPKSQREASFTIAALHQWEMDIDDTRCVDSAEEVSLILLCFYFSHLPPPPFCDGVCVSIEPSAYTAYSVGFRNLETCACRGAHPMCEFNLGPYSLMN
jgi:hypothetical protein